MVSAAPIRRLTDFITLIERLVTEWGGSPPFWFRGQAQADWRLEPKLFRFERPDETALRIDFRRLGMEMITGSKPVDHWEWYFLAQHFGTPTRLLDWTESALFALYFAVRHRNSGDHRGNAAVWLLDPKWLNEKAGIRPNLLIPGNEIDSWLPQDERGKVKAISPIAVAPPHVDRRVAAQRSQFVLFGLNPAGLSDLVSVHDSRLKRIEIEGRAASNLFEELTLCGIYETTLFPDLEALARELQEKYAGPKKRPAK